MIVKDEAENIGRCIESARSLFDYAAVVDTGSTDGTQDVIRELVPDVLLEEREWVDFPTNRNQALRLAESTGADYVLILDADDELVDKPDSWGPLGADLYYLHYDGPFDTAQIRLIKTSLGWEWVDRRHNRLVCDDPDSRTHGDLYRPLVRHHGWTRHNKEKRAEADLTALRAMLEEEPSPRVLFNIGQTLEVLGREEEAIRAYRARVKYPGDDEERWYCQYRLGDLLMGTSFNDGAEALLEAWRMRPWRNAPLRKLAVHCENVSDRMPYPYGDMLFIRRESYRTD